MAIVKSVGIMVQTVWGDLIVALPVFVVYFDTTIILLNRKK